MVITYHGAAFCKVSQGDTTLAFSPIGKQSSLSVPKSGADVALIPIDLPDFNGADTVTHSGKEPFTVNGPGEYEVGGIMIRGFASEGPHTLSNTVYTVHWDDITFCHSGALTVPQLPGEALESLGDIDVLFICLDAENGLNAKDAQKLIKQVEPRITIPLAGPSGDTEYATFLKEVGVAGSPVDRFTFKKRDIETRNGDVITLEPA